MPRTPDLDKRAVVVADLLEQADQNQGAAIGWEMELHVEECPCETGGECPENPYARYLVTPRQAARDSRTGWRLARTTLQGMVRQGLAEPFPSTNTVRVLLLDDVPHRDFTGFVAEGVRLFAKRQQQEEWADARSADLGEEEIRAARLQTLYEQEWRRQRIVEECFEEGAAAFVDSERIAPT